MLNFVCCVFRAFKSEYENLPRKEPIHSEVEARLECSNRYADARLEYCEEAACCFRFGRV